MSLVCREPSANNGGYCVWDIRCPPRPAGLPLPDLLDHWNRILGSQNESFEIPAR